MKRFVFLIGLAIVAIGLGDVQTVGALTSNPKTYITGDNVFYAYVIAGEKVSVDFTKVDQIEPTSIVKEPVTVTVDAPGMESKTCSMPAAIANGAGCKFADLTAVKTGIWRISFHLPKEAHVHADVASSVHWGANHFSWAIGIKDSIGEKKGRVWSELYAIRQPAPSSFLADLTFYYLSENGYLYRAIYRGYNGQLSTLSADAFGIVRKGTCTAAYESIQVSNTDMVPSFGSCGGSYKLFFEQPSDDLPEEATQWDDKTGWVRPKIDRPVVEGLKFTPDQSLDVQSGAISYTLKNFIGQYEIKIDTNADGNYDSQDDVTLKRQIKNLKEAGEQKVVFNGLDGGGVKISRTQRVKIKINISKTAEIHLVGADIEGRQGGIELTRLSGDNAPNSQVCWNDTELMPATDGLNSKLVLDGRNCPESTGGVHVWKYSDSDGGTWGNARYIDDWAYASARVQGMAEITYPTEQQESDAAAMRSINIGMIIGGALLVGAAVSGVVVWRKRKKRQAALRAFEQPPLPTVPQTQNTPPHYPGDDTPPRPPQI